MPTIHTIATSKQPSTLQLQAHQENLQKYKCIIMTSSLILEKIDKTTKFVDINRSQASAKYLFRKISECIVFYKLVFCVTKGFPKIFGAIKIDKDLHVQWNGAEILFHFPNRLLELLIHMVEFFAVLFWSRKLSIESTCIYTFNSVLYDLIRFLVL